MALISISLFDSQKQPVNAAKVEVFESLGFAEIGNGFTGYDASTGKWDQPPNVIKLRVPDGNYAVNAFKERQDDFYNPVFIIDVKEDSPDGNDFVITDPYTRIKIIQMSMYVTNLRNYVIEQVLPSEWGSSIALLDPRIWFDDAVLSTWATSPMRNMIMGGINRELYGQGIRVESVAFDFKANRITYNIVSRKESPVAPLVAVILVGAIILGTILGAGFLVQQLTSLSLATAQRDLTAAKAEALLAAQLREAKILKYKVTECSKINEQVAKGEISEEDGKRRCDEVIKQASDMQDRSDGVKNDDVDEIDKSQDDLDDTKVAVDEGGGPAGADPLAILNQAIPVIVGLTILGAVISVTKSMKG